VRHNAPAAAAAAAVAVAIDDDSMSVTSREVAAILSTASPMAPPSEDDDDDTNYDDDDVSELEEQHRRRLSSAMQLLRVSSGSSASASNTSTGTSIGISTPPRNRNVQLTPFRSHHNAAQLNTGRRADEFRPQLNGVCDVNSHQLHHGNVNGGGYWAGVGSVERLRRQHLTLFDLLRTHQLFVLTLELRLKNGHHVHGPPFQVSSRKIIRSLGHR